MGYPYAAARNFYDYLKAEAIVNSARRVVAVDPSTNRLLVPGHGLTSGDALRVELGDAPLGDTAALPSPLSAFTPYYALVASSDLIAVASSSGGSAIDITTAGTGLLSIVVDMEASLNRVLASNASRLDSCLARRGVELPLVGDFPALASLVVRLSAWWILLARGYTSGRQVDPDQDYKLLSKDAEDELSDLCAGKPSDLLAGLPIAATATKSSVWDLNARGWTPDGGGI
jgi:hypothetical protein